MPEGEGGPRRCQEGAGREQEGAGGGTQGPDLAEGEGRPAGERTRGASRSPRGGQGRTRAGDGQPVPEHGQLQGGPGGPGAPGARGLLQAAVRDVEGGRGDLQERGLLPGGHPGRVQGQALEGDRGEPPEPGPAAEPGEGAGRPEDAQRTAGAAPRQGVAGRAGGPRAVAVGHRILGEGEAGLEGSDRARPRRPTAAHALENVPQPGGGHLQDTFGS